MRRLFLSFMSSFMLALPFFSPRWHWFIWISLVPLIILLDELHGCLFFYPSYQRVYTSITKTSFLRQLWLSFIFSYLCGFIFFLLVLYWLNNVTVAGTLLLVGYLALYFGLFGFFTACISNERAGLKIFIIPCIWVSLEFIRANLFTGFGWCALGYSQYENIALIQIADITGVYGVSFLIVLANVFFANVWKYILRYKLGVFKCINNEGKFLCIQFFLISFIFLGIYGYGILRLRQEDSEASTAVSVAVVQADIPQQIKWNESAWPVIMEEYKSLTVRAAAYHPQLIVWPETSLPGYLGERNPFFAELKGFVKDIGIPLLFGAVVLENGRYYNSAILLSSTGEKLGRYDKLHLVPFGEYIPLRGVFPFLEDIVPIGDFTAGSKYKVFPFLGIRGGKSSIERGFSVLICFEDTVPKLSRRFVRRGAGLLINITNDGWFKDTIAPYLHLQSSVFRTIENRRPLIRAANTGISCFIDNRGKIYNYVLDLQGRKTFISGYSVGQVHFGTHKSFYTNFGDIFVVLCFVPFILSLFNNLARLGIQKLKKI